MVVAVLAIIVIGPKDLPKALRTVGQWVGKARRMAREFQGSIDEMVRESELDEVRSTIQQARSFDVKGEIEKTIDPDGDLRSTVSEVETSIGEVSKDLDKELENKEYTPPSPTESPDEDEQFDEDTRALLGDDYLKELKAAEDSGGEDAEDAPATGEEDAGGRDGEDDGADSGANTGKAGA